MKLMLCAVLDKQVGAMTPPQCFRSKGEALRSFMDACAQENGNFNRHAVDYVFVHVGDFDDCTGELSGKPVQLVTALECVSRKESIGHHPV